MKERGRNGEGEGDPLRFIPAAPVRAREMIKRCRSLRRGKNRLGEETFSPPFGADKVERIPHQMDL